MGHVCTQFLLCVVVHFVIIIYVYICICIYLFLNIVVLFCFVFFVFFVFFLIINSSECVYSLQFDGLTICVMCSCVPRAILSYVSIFDILHGFGILQFVFVVSFC